MAAQKADIHQMPRGGPDASWLDRLLETDRPEYLNRDDVDEVRGLERMGSLFGNHKKFARLTLDEVADIPDPKIVHSARATAVRPGTSARVRRCDQLPALIQPFGTAGTCQVRPTRRSVCNSVAGC